MRYPIGALLVLLVVASGCMSAADQARLDDLAVQVVQLERQAESVVGEIKAGSIPLDAGTALLADIRETIREARAEIRDIQERGNYSAWEWIGAAVAASLFGVRAWRGPSHRQQGEL